MVAFRDWDVTMEVPHGQAVVRYEQVSFTHIPLSLCTRNLFLASATPNHQPPSAITAHFCFLRPLALMI